MPCNTCKADPCTCSVDVIFKEILDGLDKTPPESLSKEKDRLEELAARFEELKNDLGEAKKDLALIKTSLGVLIQTATNQEARLIQVENYINASAKTACLYYEWVLKLIAHAGLKPELTKKKVETPIPPPPPPAEDGDTTVTTQSYEPGKSEPHDGMYG